MRGRAIRNRRWSCACIAAVLPLLVSAQSTMPSTRSVPLQGRSSAAVSRAALSPSAAFALKADSLLGTPPVNRGAWGILVEDAVTGETLYERNADSYFVPASNLKLLTTAIALDKLGPDFRFRTTLETNGTLSTDGVVNGDLILVGRGDPNLSNRKFPFEQTEEFDGPPEKALAELADDLVKRGVKEITGDIVGDDSYFPRDRYPDGWEIGDIVWEYGAAISAICVNDNTVTLLLSPGEKAGDPAFVGLQLPESEFQVFNRVITSAPGEKADLRLTREPGSDTVVISGTIPLRTSTRKLVLAIQEPAQFAAALLARQLDDRGIKYRGKIRAIHEPNSGEASRIMLAEHLSIPLSDSVKLVNKISQNLHAELLLRTAARQDGIWATPEDLAKVPREFYVKAGISLDDIVQVDGSGLSRHDLVTPRAFVTLLQYAQKQTWFPAYFASLPVAGEDGTLNERLKNTKLAGRIHAKTGSITHVRALSGYADTPGGRRLIFSFLSNNQASKNHEVHDAMDGLCVAMFEAFNGPPVPMKQLSKKTSSTEPSSIRNDEKK